MRQKPVIRKSPAERVLKEIRRRTRKQHSAEEKIRIVLEGLRGEESIAELCRREGIATSLYYKWSKEFLEAGKKGFEALPRRWVVERTFAWLSRCRRLAKDWEKSLASSTAWTLIASIRLMTRRLARYCHVS